MHSTHTISLPIVIRADDYHRFDVFEDILADLIGQKVSSEEIDVDPDDPNFDSYTAGLTLGDPDYACYFAIFYTGKRDQHIKAAIQTFLNSPQTRVGKARRTPASADEDAPRNSGFDLGKMRKLMGRSTG